MSQLLTEAKKALWREGLRPTPTFLDTVESLLLEKLSVLGEITEDDRLWAKQTVDATFPGIRAC